MFQHLLDGVNSQVSEVMILGQQLRHSSFDEDVDQGLKELATLWNLALQGMLLTLGIFSFEYAI